MEMYIFAMAHPSPWILVDSRNYVKTVLGANKYAAFAFRLLPKNTGSFTTVLLHLCEIRGEIQVWAQDHIASY